MSDRRFNLTFNGFSRKSNNTLVRFSVQNFVKRNGSVIKFVKIKKK